MFSLTLPCSSITHLLSGVDTCALVQTTRKKRSVARTHIQEIHFHCACRITTPKTGGILEKRMYCVCIVCACVVRVCCVLSVVCVRVWCVVGEGEEKKDKVEIMQQKHQKKLKKNRTEQAKHMVNSAWQIQKKRRNNGKMSKHGLRV